MMPPTGPDSIIATGRSVATSGGITPPFGYIIFALKAAVPEISLTDLYPPAWLFTFMA